MAGKHKNTLLTLLIITDLTCFALGGLNYGEQWSIAGVIGLLAFLALLEGL